MIFIKVGKMVTVRLRLRWEKEKQEIINFKLPLQSVCNLAMREAICIYIYMVEVFFHPQGMGTLTTSKTSPQ